MVQPLLQWTSNLSVCICSLRYPACNAHAPCCHLWPALLYNIFPHYLINGTIFEKKKKRLLNIKCVFIFSTTFVWNISHSTKKWARYDQNCILVSMQSTLYSCQILKKREFSWQIFEESSNIKFRENPSSGSRHVLYWGTDRRTDMTKLIVAFRYFANAP